MWWEWEARRALGAGAAGAGAGVRAQVRDSANCSPNRDTSFFMFYSELILDLQKRYKSSRESPRVAFPQLGGHCGVALATTAPWSPTSFPANCRGDPRTPSGTRIAFGCSRLQSLLRLVTFPCLSLSPVSLAPLKSAGVPVSCLVECSSPRGWLAFSHG